MNNHKLLHSDTIIKFRYLNWTSRAWLLFLCRKSLI